MTQVVAFGAFDPLHAGHLDFFRQARALGDDLLVVVATDSNIRRLKKREPRVPELERLKQVQMAACVDQARLGSGGSDRYVLLSELTFDVLALGYDQEPGDGAVKAELVRRGKGYARVIRLKAFEPGKYKSSLM